MIFLQKINSQNYRRSVKWVCISTEISIDIYAKTTSRCDRTAEILHRTNINHNVIVRVNELLHIFVRVSWQLVKLRVHTQRLTDIIILSYNLAYDQNFKHDFLPTSSTNLCSLNIFRQVHRNIPTMFQCIKTKSMNCPFYNKCSRIVSLCIHLKGQNFDNYAKLLTHNKSNTWILSESQMPACLLQQC